MGSDSLGMSRLRSGGLRLDGLKRADGRRPQVWRKDSMGWHGLGLHHMDMQIGCCRISLMTRK